MTHKGHLEGGINPDNYFLLVKDQGGFTAVPLAAWYNFRPPPRRAAMSLEEAEAEMEKKHNSHFGGTGRLSQAIARNEGVRQILMCDTANSDSTQSSTGTQKACLCQSAAAVPIGLTQTTNHQCVASIIMQELKTCVFVRGEEEYSP